MKDNLIIIGVNGPRIHQAIIAKLIYGLTDLYLNAQTQVYDIPEGFIYDYKLGIWYKYDLQKGEQNESSSWCNAVGVDLAKLLF